MSEISRERDPDNADWKRGWVADFGIVEVHMYPDMPWRFHISTAHLLNRVETEKLSTDLTAALAWAQRQGKEGVQP